MIAFSATVEEFECPVGSYRPTVGAQNISDCQPCDAGWYCLVGESAPNAQCEPGFYCPSPFTNPFATEPSEIGSYGPKQVSQLSFSLCAGSALLVTDT